ncbi:uncharacterized protein PHACADRAFT_204704 [Phanerochaete carnosa HHB-10118-sp]|uniref:Protein kinase domain-containing protein n=1 Tax=Phanerochaete carnosa (strain HHB-10118-sp) TaxID=650164 RepID=K5VET0_PHACS|nr:uncharacterized protein PHACADRAFT_204704 [Phanerochaete carnosa HHB-10118-sp]EKM61536.1 hypothetical protein PHACADRAFT_204704 [Phanerochaete carnosa HHB-10118-sp]
MGWVHRDISTGNILVYDGRGLLTDFEYAKRWDTEEHTSHQMRTGTEYFMSLEVDAHEYLFQIQGVGRPETIPHRGGKKSFTKLVGALPSHFETQVKPALPFRYHPLNDWESLFWVSMYMMVIDRIVKPTKNQPQQTSDKLEKQRALARGLFYSYKERSVKFSQAAANQVDPFKETLLDCLHDDLKHVATALGNIRVALLNAYREVEANPDQHPDGAVSVDIIWDTIPSQYNKICQILDAQDITVERLPVRQGLKAA